MSSTHQNTIYGTLCSLYYDAKEQYAKPDEVDFYATFVPSPNHTILEAMSGSGRLQIPLLQRGYRVDGVDNSPSMLARCRQRCAQLNIHPRLFEQNIELLSLPDRYHTAIITMGSFQLIPDYAIALQALQKIRAHLHDNGNLLLDMFVPDLSSQENSRATDSIRIDEHRVIRFTTRHLFHENTQRVDALCAYELIVDGVLTEREEEYMEFVWYSDAELANLLNNAGFAINAVYEKPFRRASMSSIVHAVAY